jgi:hypothetical protein
MSIMKSDLRSFNVFLNKSFDGKISNIKLLLWGCGGSVVKGTVSQDVG